MIDFRKKLGGPSGQKKTDPIEIYNSLDRASDKGPLRPAQEYILKAWFDTFKNNKDVILKLHTGQGKTLIGLLILQSKLNEGVGPALYICPNNHLIQQTKEQAKQFGIKTVTTDDELPLNFLDSKIIFITSVQKLFNGFTKFGLNSRSIELGTIVIDDAHACIESIRNSFIVKIKKGENVYHKLLSLFNQELENQGMGTFSDIKDGSYDSFLLVPYWSWQSKHQEVLTILSNHNNEDSIKFQWPLLKDIIKDCQCMISGDSIEIAPYSNPVEVFGSYQKASHRIFMSATINDDSFFLKTLGVDAETIQNPLQLKDEKWSGEKMILIPELIDESLDRIEIINHFAIPKKDRRYGVVALTPSMKRAEIWQKCGAVLATTKSIETEIGYLKQEDCEKTLVIANRYDGIDLPDHMCRLLIIDSKPFSETLFDKYQENCRPDSDIIGIKVAQKVEQGLGRGVRGEKDYCAILLVDPELVRAIKGRKSKKYFSDQTKNQIQIGFEVAEYAEDELKNGKAPLRVLLDILNQSLSRDDSWKEFYVQRMNEMEISARDGKVLEILKIEKEAEGKYREGKFTAASAMMERLADSSMVNSESEKGWYLQEAARLLFPENPSKANQIQVGAHRSNNFLLKPEQGMIIKKINLVGQKRIEILVEWIKQFSTYEELMLKINEMLGSLTFGTKADKFENSLNELASALGFAGDRPDKQWKEGPDNLWTIKDNEYILFECKNEVATNRVEINKEETKQMNNSIAWFEREYGEANVKSILIIPGKIFGKGAALPKDVEVMRETHLKKLRQNVRYFFQEFKDLDFNNLSENKIQEFLQSNKLSVEDFKSLYSEKPSLLPNLK